MAQSQVNLLAATKKEAKIAQPGSRCCWCFNIYKEKLWRHIELCKLCPYSGDEKKQRVARLKEKSQRSDAARQLNKFFNPAEFEDRLYTKRELLHNMEEWGHQAIPEEMEGKVSLKPTRIEDVTFRFASGGQQDSTRSGVSLPAPVGLNRESGSRLMGLAASTRKRPTSVRQSPDMSQEEATDATNKEVSKIPTVVRSAEEVSDRGLEPCDVLLCDTPTPERSESRATEGHLPYDGQDSVIYSPVHHDMEPSPEGQIDDDMPSPSEIDSSEDEDSDSEGVSAFEDMEQPSARKRIDFGGDESGDEDEPIARARKRPQHTDLISSPEDTPIVKKPRNKSGPKRSPYGYKRSTKRTPKKKSLINTINYETGVKKTASDAGWYGVPSIYQEQDIFKKFHDYYTLKKKGRNLKNNFSNVLRMCYHMTDGASNFKINELTTKAFKAMVNTMSDEYSFDVQTVVNYIKSMKHFLTFLRKDSSLKMKVTQPTLYQDLKYVEHDVTIMFRSYENDRKQLKKEERAQKTLPPTPYEVQEVIRKGTRSFENLLAKSEKTRLNKIEISELNRHICCYVCLKLAHRPSVPENMIDRCYLEAMQNPKTEQGQTYWVIPVPKHKTSSMYTAYVVLDEYWKQHIETYYKNVRKEIIDRTKTESTALLLQHNGCPFKKISQGVSQHQMRHKMKEIYTTTTARISYETFFGACSLDTRKGVNVQLTHSGLVAETVYNIGDVMKSVRTTRQMSGMSQYYSQHTKSDPMPKDLDISSPGKAVDNNFKSNTASSSSQHTFQRNTRAPTTATISNPEEYERVYGGTEDEPSTSATVSLPAAASTATPTKTPPPAASTLKTPVKTPIGIKTDKILSALRDLSDDLRFAEIPSVKDIVDTYGYKQDAAKKITRKLRYQREQDWAKHVAQKEVRRYARAQKVAVASLTETPPAPSEAELKRQAPTITLKAKDVVRHMKDVISQAKTDVFFVDDGTLIRKIKKQNWQGIVKNNDVEGKGRGVFNGPIELKKGQIVCDYHGLITTAQNGEETIKTLPPPTCNYVLFFREVDGTKLCVDATSKCECHPPLEFFNTVGRLVNHSSKNANLHPKRLNFDAGPNILLIAIRDIEPHEELLFDYGVRQSECGERLPWMKA